MQYLFFAAKPQSDNPEAEEYGGAFVGCWIKDRTEDEARSVAEIMIEDNGWIPTKIEEQYPVTAEILDEGSEGKEYFEQALIDGEVIVFYTFPRDTKK